MADPKGFMTTPREVAARRPVEERVHDWKEVYPGTPGRALLPIITQQAGRCMDCGIPFCHNGCPLGNLIPEWNDLVWRDEWQPALERLHATNNFPEFTGRLCPAPCETACVVGINRDAVTIKNVEVAIIDKAWDDLRVTPQQPAWHTSKTVAVVGSGPAGLAVAQQLTRAGHTVVVYERADAIGGLLRYGIPDFKLDKVHIDRRALQLQAEGVTIRTGVLVAGKDGMGKDSKVTNWAKETVSPEQLKAEFDAVLLTGGSEQSRDLPVTGRDLDGVHFAMEFLPQQNKINAGDKLKGQLRADGKHVIVIGGGDTGSDCVGTSNRHGALSVTQFELMPMPPEHENGPLVWPYWPIKLRTSSSHEEGVQREFAIATQAFIGDAKGGKGGKLKALRTVHVEPRDGKFVEVPGTEREWPAELVLLAMGFTNPVATVLEAFGVDKDARGNAKATTDVQRGYATNVKRVFAAGDMRRGQSLVVWAIREGRQAAHAVDAFLMGTSDLPR